MARARKAKRRARDARGHFKKKTKRTHARKPNPARRKRTAHKRPAKRKAHRRAAKRVTRVKRALGRKKSSGRFTRRAKHRVRGFRRKVAGRRKKTLVRSHLSYEAAEPTKRKRRRSRRAKEEVVMENPRKRRRSKRKARRHTAMENPRPRKRRRARKANPRKRAARRRTVTAVMPAVVRRRTRKGGRRTSPAAVKVVVIRGLSGGGRSRKRRSSSKRRKGHSKKRKHARKRKSHRKGYTRKNRQLGAGPHPQLSMFQEPGFFENPLGGYALENPLGGWELALAGGTAAIGFVVVDFLDRYLAVKQYAPATVTTGQTALVPSQAVDTVPSVTRILAQAGIAAASFAGAHFVEKPLLKASLQGAGLGALTHLLGQLFNHYVMAKLIPNATAGGMIAGWQPYYQQEIQADSAAAASGLQGVGFLGLGAPPAQRPRVLQRPGVSAPFRDPGPRAVAGPPQGVGTSGDCTPACGPTPCGAQDGQSVAYQAAVAATQSPDQDQPVAVMTPIQTPPVASGSNGRGNPLSGLGSITWFDDSPSAD